MLATKILGKTLPSFFLDMPRRGNRALARLPVVPAACAALFYQTDRMSLCDFDTVARVAQKHMVKQQSNNLE
jgi:hypothetical protein